MKKLLFIPLFMMCATVFAQNFQLGLKAGMNVSNFTGSNFENVEKKAIIGFNGGAFLGLMFGDNFSIQPEVLFSSQGAKFETVGQSQQFKVSYLNVPVLAKYRFDGGFYLEAGPQVGFKINEKVPGNTPENFAKDLDFAFDAGLGYHGRSGLGVGARYIAGLSKVGDFDAGDLNPDFKNGVAQLFIFYTFFNNR